MAFIEKEPFISVLQHSLTTHPDYDPITIDAIRLFIELINDRPEATVREDIHASWVQRGFEIYCSNCWCEAYIDKNNQYITSSYCGRCGAKMSRR